MTDRKINIKVNGKEVKSTKRIVDRSFIIVGWEYNDTWQTCDLYFGEEDEILKTTDDFDMAIKFDDIDEAYKKLKYLKENFSDYGWYITII